MATNETQAKSILSKKKRVDSWFVARYGMNIYRGCLHNCAYCDGRAEGYYVEGDFGRDVVVKTNAVELLDTALNPARKRVSLKKGFVMLGGGVGDSYQDLEEKYGLVRGCLEIVSRRGFPVHVLTKSTLVERDFDLLDTINRQNRAIVSMSFSTVDDDLAGIFEPGCPPPSKRLETLAAAKELGLATGFFLMPVIPGISDKPEMIGQSVKAAKKAGVDFMLFSGMTLKNGRQREHFTRLIEKFDDKLVPGYDKIYDGNKWGGAHPKYYERIEGRFKEAASKYGMKRRMPSRLFGDVIDPDDVVIVILDQLGYFLKSKGKKNSLGYAAHSLSKIKKPLSHLRDSLSSVKGVDAAAEKLIWEIMDNGTCELYESFFP